MVVGGDETYIQLPGTAMAQVRSRLWRVGRRVLRRTMLMMQALDDYA